MKAAYSLLNGFASYVNTQSSSASRVPEKIVSKPPTPKFYEVLIPLFRFIGYGGGKAVINPTSVTKAEKRIDEAGLGEAYEEHMAGQSGLVFQVRRTGYLERAPRVSKDVVATAFILLDEIGVEREPELEPRIINPVAMTYRVYSSELSDEHVDTLKAHAASGEPIKFKGQPHTVKAVTGGWSVIYNRFETNYDLEKVRK